MRKNKAEVVRVKGDKFLAVVISFGDVEEYKVFNSKEEAIEYLLYKIENTFDEWEIELYNIKKEDIEKIVRAARVMLKVANEVRFRKTTYKILEV